MKRHLTALAAGLVLAAGCSDTIVATENLPSADALNGPLTVANAQVLTLGVLANDRALIRADLTYLVLTEVYARDAYRIDPNEPRYVTETLTGTPDPGGFSGSGGWTNGYVTLRAAQTLLEKLPTASSEISAAQRSAMAGFLRTIKALEYYRLLELRDANGIVLQPADPAAVGTIICKTAALNYIAALLDSANTDLATAGAGTNLPVTLPTGFTAFGRNYSNVANLVKLNRGLKGKVDVYRALDNAATRSARLADAITELTAALGGAAPGAVPASQFKTGAYVTFVAGGTENAANPLFDNLIGVNPKAVTAFDSLDPGKVDARRSKIIPFSSGKTIAGSGVSTNLTYAGASTANGANQTAPIAILRDEEVVLLRAQAYIESNNLAAATLDLNSVHQAYQPTALAPADVAEARRLLLLEKRFSLFFEGPQRLVDLRAYNLLKAGVITPETSSDPFNTAFPITKTEADVRGGRQNLTPVCS
jgi:hypothetical protein